MTTQLIADQMMGTWRRRAQWLSPVPSDDQIMEAARVTIGFMVLADRLATSIQGRIEATAPMVVVLRGRGALPVQEQWCGQPVGLGRP